MIIALHVAHTALLIVELNVFLICFTLCVSPCLTFMLDWAVNVK